MATMEGVFWKNRASLLRKFLISGVLLQLCIILFSDRGLCVESLVVKAHCAYQYSALERKANIAINQGDIEYIKREIRRNTPIDVKTRLLTEFELHPILTPEQLQIGKYLVEIGADPNAQYISCNEGMPSQPVVPGYRFINSESNLQFALFLLEKGLKPTHGLAIDTIRMVAPSYSNQNGHAQMARRAGLLLDAYVKHGLLEQGKVNFPSVAETFEYTSFPHLGRYQEFVAELLEKGILNPDTPLFHAKSGDEAKLFIAHGGNPAVLNADGETPLHIAVRAGNVPVV